MKRAFMLSLMLLSFAALPAHAQETKPDDQVAFNLSAESWVTTKSARVTLGVEAAVTGGSAGTMRGTMLKAINDTAKGDWRLTSFNRNQDETGMERWSAQFEARLPENDLNALGESAKKNSKAGMQITVSDIDFTPTLEETQTVQSQLRTQIYKLANEQLAALNATVTGRNYRIATLDFVYGSVGPTPYASHGVRTMNMKGGMAEMAMAPAPASDSMVAMEKSDKITLTARVVLAALPPVTAAPLAPK